MQFQRRIAQGLAPGVSDGDLQPVVARIRRLGNKLPTFLLRLADVTRHVKPVVVGCLRQNDIVEVDAHLHTGDRVEFRRKCQP